MRWRASANTYECTDFKTQEISQHKIISPLILENLETSNIWKLIISTFLYFTIDMIMILLR